VYFGVNSGATRFALEQQAVNEATFRCPDEFGWKPQKSPIVPADGSITRTREVRGAILIRSFCVLSTVSLAMLIRSCL
ncbi:hypothetical protein IFM89_002450, partial [Coptis chinensis]